MPYPGWPWPQAQSTSVIWGLWFFGNRRNEIAPIGPYKNIRPTRDLRLKHCRVRRSRCSNVIKTLIDFAIQDNLIQSQSDITLDNNRAIFDHSYVKLMEELYGNNPNKRVSDLVIDSVYERIQVVRRSNK